ncbi:MULTISPECIES: alpha/beta fold hydrolase [Amycolatopsis]|nr:MULTISPECIES: alpha/beta fold hydrolase [Amycolatopsis]OAP28372.1 Alpha/beta hydrolase family protein [Amycolatopsis sp. M39]
MMTTISAPTPVTTVSPVTIPASYRGQDLQVKVSAPTSGDGLPTIVFAHGFSLASRDYAPLADYWAARGFVVIQPTFLDSKTLGLAPDDPRTPDIWRLRVQDMSHVADSLELIERTVPGLAGRIDRTRLIAAGHSYGAQTAGMLLGERVRDAAGTPGESMTDARFTVGILLAHPGDGDSLNELAQTYFPFMRPDFTELTAPAFLAAGDHDQSPLSTRGPDWFTDVYTMSPANKTLLTLFGGEHGLGGINGYEAAATTDENPQRVELVQRLSTAWLRAAVLGDAEDWTVAADELHSEPEPAGRLESK